MREPEKLMYTSEVKPLKNTCPVCEAKDIRSCIDIDQVPVHCNLLWPTRAEAVNAPKGDIRLGFCRRCGHIFNGVFNPEYMKYDQEYENSLHFSPRFQEYARTLAERLIERYDLHDKVIIEIGCGKGDFLLMLCTLGGNRGIGFDTSYARERTADANTERVVFIQDYYSERYADYEADIICCRHVLEHIQSPRDFLIDMRRAAGNRSGTAVFFEVPNIAFTLRDLGIWDLIYEHCSYFSVSSLVHVFSSCGFAVRDIYETFEGQFLCIEALSDNDIVHTEHPYQNDIERMEQDVVAFSDRYKNKVEKWKHDLDSLNRAGKKVVVWGGGSKGVTFLNALNIDEQIQYIVDINPHKQGKFAPGTGQEIVNPEFLLEYRPDCIIAMNPVYMNEIRQMVERMAVTAEIIPV